MLSNVEIKKRLLNGGNVELEHTDVTKGDLKKTYKIAKAHLNENPDYYDMLEILENPKNYSKIMSLRPSCCNGGCYACGGNLNIIKQKNDKSLTGQIKNVIALISKNKKNSEIFGSYVYRSQFFPSDIDIHEVVSTTPSRPEQIYKKMAESLQTIVKNIKKRRGIYYGEVKAGIDTRFDIDINDPQLIEKFKYLFSNNLITNEELKKIIQLYNNNEHDELEELIRNFQIIRWRQDEIIKGNKKIRGNKKILLADAMRGHTNIKLDIWAPINGRYIEITNFYFLVIYDKKTKKIIVLNHEIGEYVEEILKQIVKYQKPLFFNPFKMAKRIWGIARETQNIKLLNTLTPLFQSGIARINQIIAEIETIIMMSEQIKSMPWMTILKQIDEFKLRLSYIYDIQFDEDKIIRWIDGALKHHGDRRQLIHKLTMLKQFLKEIVNVNTVEWLKKNNMYPVPKYIYNITGKTQNINEYPLFKMKLLGEKKKNSTLSIQKHKKIHKIRYIPPDEEKQYIIKPSVPIITPSVPIITPIQVLNEMSLLQLEPTRENIHPAELRKLAESRNIMTSEPLLKHYASFLKLEPTRENIHPAELKKFAESRNIMTSEPLLKLSKYNIDMYTKKINNAFDLNLSNKDMIILKKIHEINDVTKRNVNIKKFVLNILNKRMYYNYISKIISIIDNAGKKKLPKDVGKKKLPNIKKIILNEIKKDIGINLEKSELKKMMMLYLDIMKKPDNINNTIMNFINKNYGTTEGFLIVRDILIFIDELDSHI